jgi:signal transduction histidine kinase
MSTAALVLALSILAIGLAAAAFTALLPTLRAQLAALALVAVCLPLGAVLASGLVMFKMQDYEKIVVVSLISATSALCGALLLGRRILQPLGRLRGASTRLAEGDLTARAPESGPQELQELSVSFNEMAASLERLFDARRELVAWASHDLRTPIAALSAMVEALEDGLATPAEYVPAIRAQTEILSALVEDLFELARIDAGALRLELRETPVGELVASCLGALEAEARANEVRLAARLGEDPVVLVAPDKVRRVLLNLLSNAIRHSPPHGEVAVVAEADTDRAVVAVEDEGNGLPPAACERMFERFWRDDGSRTRASGGAGLGLAIAQGLVHAHGGTIWAENRPGGGARVAFTLPLAAPGAVRLDPAYREPAAAGPATRPGRPARAPGASPGPALQATSSGLPRPNPEARL